MKRISIFINLLLIILFASETAPAVGSQKVWIYFKDKGGQAEQLLTKPTALVSPRSLERRARALPTGQWTDYLDVPVNPEYIRRLTPYLIKLRHRSRWLNAVSAEIDPNRISEILALDFVDAVENVHLSSRRFPPPQPESLPALSKSAMKVTSLDYGTSYTQLAQIHVPELHDKGIYGQGVLICMLDNGYRLWQRHEAFDSMDVVAVWDFADGDDDVTDGSHGNNTLSTIGAYKPGQLIGPAFKASYLLARTEVDGSETPAEEDNWVAGIEWADSMGADIVSSSLGYNEFDPGYEDYNYRYRDLDGKTAVTTIAAEIAADKGILVFNSAGNEYQYDWHYIITPADGERVMTIAGVWSDGERAWFSSVGPTADGRIKPDIAAMGVNVKVASASNPTGYNHFNGTSFSCPLAAGVGALLMSAFPKATPEDIRQALKQTASQADYPDTSLGYGIIDALAAFNYLAGKVGGSTEVHIKDPLAFPNPTQNQASVQFTVTDLARVEIDFFNTLGQKVFNKGFNYYFEGRQQIDIHLPASLPSGMYFYRLTARTPEGSGISYAHGKLVLLH